MNIRRPAGIAELLRDVFHPVTEASWSPGTIDRCVARGLTLSHCQQMGWANACSRGFNCSMARNSIPQLAGPVYITDDYGTVERFCEFRRFGGLRGPSSPNPRVPRVDATPKQRRWAEGAVWEAATRDDLIGLTARAYTMGDWTAVDEHPSKQSWLEHENQARKRTDNLVLGRDEIANAWRSFAQWKLFCHVARRCQAARKAANKAAT